MSSPDLKVVCRKLAAATPSELPTLCPSLAAHILRCGDALAVSLEQQGKAKAKASEGAVLVHRLKTQVRTLLQAKTPQGRFAGVVLAKAVVDVGGWECLRTAEPWVRALLAIAQKPDPAASKELAVLALARIYALLPPFPTLVREMATPTLPTFAQACLVLVRGVTTRKVPVRLAETAVRALASLMPLYPATLRPFVAQARAAVAPLVAPTSADALVVPASLQDASRRLLAALHYTAAKNGNADEWRALLDSIVTEAHATADQVFRAVREARDPGGTYEPGDVSCDGAPHGGRASDETVPDKNKNDKSGTVPFPAWSGLQAGAERLAGLVATVGVFLESATKAPVAVPLAAIMGLASRIAVVLAPGSCSGFGSAAAETDTALFNPSIGRDERDELWALLPRLHAAALALLAVVVARMGTNAVPLVPEVLEHAARVFAADRDVPRVRQLAFELVHATLPLVGPTMTKSGVDGIVRVARACCHDILEAAGHYTPPKTSDDKPMGAGAGAGSGAAGVAGAKNRLTPIANADLFLRAHTAASDDLAPTRFAPDHLRAAHALLVAVLALVPPQHVKKADRALLDRTAVLSADRDAMVASVLQPYVDNSGRYFANTVPFLARAHPHDIAMEVLRSNLRTAPHYYGDIFSSTVPGEHDEEDEEEEDDEDKNDNDSEDETGAMEGVESAPTQGFALPAVASHSKPAPAETPAFKPLALKRKSETSDPDAAKRVDTGKLGKPVAPAVSAVSAAPAVSAVSAADADADDSDSSVQLDMVFDVPSDDDDA